MKRKIGSLLCGFALLLPLASCNFFGLPEYELSVTVEPGVVGTPASGQYVYPELEEVEYTYTPVNSLHTVEAIIDDGQEAAAGTVTIYRSLTLVARLVDIRGSWDVESYDATSNSTPFTITFSGDDILGGTFTDSLGHSGTWTGPSNKLTFTYGNWEAYVYTGALFSMTGTYKNGSASGTWSAKRVK